MVKDAVATHGLIGMALLRGRLAKGLSRESGDLSHRVHRENREHHAVFRWALQLCNLSSYRQAMVILRGESEEMERNSFFSLKDKVLDLVRRIAYYDVPPLLNIFRDPSLDQETWLNLCCYFLDLSIMEQQSLLEAKSVEERATSLLNLLQFKVIEQGTLLENIGAAGGKRPPH